MIVTYILSCIRFIKSTSPSFGEASPRFSESVLKFGESAPNLGEAELSYIHVSLEMSLRFRGDSSDGNYACIKWFFPMKSCLVE